MALFGLFVLLYVIKNWKHSCRSSVISMRSYPPQYPRPSIPLTHPTPSFFPFFCFFFSPFSFFFLLCFPFSFSLFSPSFLPLPPFFPFFFFSLLLFPLVFFPCFCVLFCFCYFCVCISVCTYVASLYPYGDNNKIHVCRPIITSSIY